MHGYVKYDGVYPFDPDPYEILQQYRDEQGLLKNSAAMVIEKYLIAANEGQTERLAVEIWGPIE